MDITWFQILYVYGRKYFDTKIILKQYTVQLHQWKIGIFILFHLQLHVYHLNIRLLMKMKKNMPFSFNECLPFHKSYEVTIKQTKRVELIKIEPRTAFFWIVRWQWRDGGWARFKRYYKTYLFNLCSMQFTFCLCPYYRESVFVFLCLALAQRQH